MSDYISIHTGATIDNAISSVINGRAGIQGIISNGTELEPDQNNKILLNVPDISQSTGNSTTATMSQNAITNQLREKANANLLNNYYQKTESYSKTEIDNIISELPKFDIKVVLALPTENISESTIYLVPTSQEEGGLYQEYVYINNRWELLGGQSVDLSDYYNRQTIDRFLDSKLDVGEVTQSVGYNSTKVMSQKAVTDELNDKFDKTSIDNYYNKAETNSLLNDRININKIVQSAGEDTTSVMSQNAITDLLNTKVDKSSIVQTTGDSNTNVMSQNAITENLSVKADRSDLNNYYDKSSVNSLLSGKMNDIGYSDVGIWTPKIGTQKEATGEYKDLTYVSYEYQEGQYIKIGKLCHINFCIKVRITNTFDNVKNYATINGFPFPASRNIRKQALAMMDIGSVPEDSIIPDWYPEPGISFEFRSTSGTHAHVERTNGLVGLEWPQVIGRWMYISGSGTYITDE